MNTLEPTKETLELALKQAKHNPAMLDVIRELIKRHKMPYKLEDGKICEIGETTEAWLNRYISLNPDILAIKDKIRKLATIDDDRDQLFCVLIIGETGTGKEILARALHGDRQSEFLAINCAGLPENLIESELFGHTSEAFTGAKTAKDGLMKSAGTLFLDEVGELPMQAQAKLLRAIQSKRIRKVGAVRDEEIKCRIVAATHRNLYEMMNEKLFREDLFARISTFELFLLPLRSRREDVIPIIQSIDMGPEFLEALSTKKEIHPDNIHWTDEMLTFNVRSLQQMVKRFKVLGELPLPK